MKKILLITLGLSVFTWADLNTNEDRSLHNIKTPYTIQDVTPERSTDIDRELLPIEKKLTTPQEDILQDAPLEQARKLENEYVSVKNAPRIKDVKKVTKEDLEIEKIRRELNIKGPSAKEIKLKEIREELNIKESSAEVQKIEKIRRELNIGYEVPKYESSLDRRMNEVKEKLGLEDGLDIDSALSSIKRTLHLEEEKKEDEGFSFNNSLRTFGNTVGMDLELPSVFGFNKKEDETFLGSTFLGDVKSTGTTFYKGAKYSGQSAQFMSGMMYNSSKMYNTMFGVFDDSPFNIFEEEEEASLFDVFEHGNTVMEMFE